MKTVIVENTWFTRDFMDFGWGNGYVLIPEGHPYYNTDYDDIDVNIHGGLTFGKIIDDEMIEKWNELSPEDKGYYMIGFDTAHLGDSLDNWPKERVQAEAERLRDQLI